MIINEYLKMVANNDIDPTRRTYAISATVFAQHMQSGRLPFRGDQESL